MARIGEGDPRWIVNEREDGRNVNSWHWEEKDVTNKAKDVFNNIILENNEKFSNQDITKISGEATFFNRRKKKGITYELSSSVSWSGTFRNEKVSGMAIFKEIGDDISEDDLDIQIRLDNTSISKEKAKAIKLDVEKHYKTMAINFHYALLEEFDIPAKKPKLQSPPPAPQSTNTSAYTGTLAALGVTVASIGILCGYFYLKNK